MTTDDPTIAPTSAPILSPKSAPLVIEVATQALTDIAQNMVAMPRVLLFGGGVPGGWSGGGVIIGGTVGKPKE